MRLRFRAFQQIRLRIRRYTCNRRHANLQLMGKIGILQRVQGPWYKIRSWGIPHVVLPMWVFCRFVQKERNVSLLSQEWFLDNLWIVWISARVVFCIPTSLSAFPGQTLAPPLPDYWRWINVSAETMVLVVYCNVCQAHYHALRHCSIQSEVTYC